MSILIKNGRIINEGLSFTGSLFLVNNRISHIYGETDELPYADEIIIAENLIVVPGIIDDQVHFREPGNTYKGCIESESAAAVLGGVTSYMDMPNNNPPATSKIALNTKNKIASESSYANWSFYLGANNDNYNEFKDANPSKICGLKVFMGSSTGNLLVDNPESLERIFSESPLLIATHCEEESVIQRNLADAVVKYGENIPFEEHRNIRSREACILSTKKAISLALKYNSRLHILHISTAEEIELIREAQRINPGITGEVCVHYMLLDSASYSSLGGKMKCNPSIKEQSDKEAIIRAVKDGIIKVVATDHAPHTLEEKSRNYMNTPSGLPLIQHSFQIMWDLHKDGHFSEFDIIDRMAHSPANNFKIVDRGFLRPGYFADILIFDPNKIDDKTTKNPAYFCGWSPFNDRSFSSSIIHTFVNGVQVVRDGALTGLKGGMKLSFNYEK
ncbi:MAG: dihydroorotase [Bacteroidales bacterium]|jgi:dihydroorotase